jgi:uncharacterized protein YecT (DUF1311 family)
MRFSEHFPLVRTLVIVVTIYACLGGALPGQESTKPAASPSVAPVAPAEAVLPFVECGRVAKPEEATESSTPQKEEPKVEYALDEATEMTLQPVPSEGGDLLFEMELRRYGVPDRGQTFLASGRLVFVSEGVYEYRADEEQTGAVVRVRGKPAGTEPLQVTSRNLQEWEGGAFELNGVFRPISPSERLQRAQQRHANADLALNAQYATTKSEVSNASARKLQEIQRDWLPRRDNRAEFAGRNAEPPQQSTEYWDAMLEETATRIEFLRVYSGKAVPKGYAGQYRDFEGGTMDLEQTKGGWKFSITTVRGIGMSNGEISGRARQKGARAFYKETSPEENEEPAELAFTFQEGHIITIQGKNTLAYHGHNAHFDGIYYKVGPLKKRIDLGK